MVHVPERSQEALALPLSHWEGRTRTRCNRALPGEPPLPARTVSTGGCGQTPPSPHATLRQATRAQERKGEAVRSKKPLVLDETVTSPRSKHPTLVSLCF